MQSTLAGSSFINAQPFLKWAGGKRQLLNDLFERLPNSISCSGSIERYIEPFVGGGAMFFYLKSHLQVKESFLYDANPELIVGYKSLQLNPELLIKLLHEIEVDYHKKDESSRRDYYYSIRDSYNNQVSEFDYSKFNKEWIDRAAYMIFLNKTCYNGLFRQNRRGIFNVPFGRYTKPTICDENNIRQTSIALRDTHIEAGDFIKSAKHVKKDTLIYLDPPYRPLNKTSHFTSYAKDGFSDDDQRRLASYFRKMDEHGAFLILSNSDPKNESSTDDFFDSLYREYTIERTLANRMINCNTGKRAAIYELIITNYR